MKSVAIKNNALVVNGKKHPLISGEFHYWRHPAANWDAIFDRIKEMGVDIISTFVPFNFHEISKGVFDFSGRTLSARNLIGFLERAKKKKFLVILRPAPNEAGEWPNGGCPERLLKYHRLHPAYVKEVKKYYDAVLAAVKPLQVTQKGPIAMIQADNEPYPDLKGRFDQIVGPRGPFKKWLKRNYENIGALNEKWNSNYRSFNDVSIFYEETLVDRDVPALRRLLSGGDLEVRFIDTQRFVKWYSARIVEWTAGYFRQAGIEVPISANTWHPTALEFVRLDKVVDCAGIDLYPARYFKGDKKYAHGREDVFKSTVESLKLVKAQIGYAYCPEFSAGLPNAWLRVMGVVADNHPVYVGLTCLAYGLKGMAYYMLVNRDNWSLSPIDELGHPTPLFNAYKEVIDVAKRVDPPSMENLCDISLLADKAHRIGECGNYHDLFNVFVEADIDFELFDPDAREAPRTKCLVYAGSERLSRGHQEKLKRFVEKGGKVLFFSRFPHFDETGRPCNVLGIPAPAGIRPISTPVNISCRGKIAYLEKHGHCGHGIHVFHYEDNGIMGGIPITTVQLGKYLAIPGGDCVFQTGKHQTAEKKITIGFIKKLGKGEFAVAGINPSPALLSLLMKDMDVPYYCRSYEPDILTTIHRKKGGKLVLFVINRNAKAAAATAHLDTEKLGIARNGEYEIKDVRKGTAEHRKGAQLSQLTAKVMEYDVNVFQIARQK